MNSYQECLLEIFNEFKRVCEAIGVSYFAFGGTLLGAVRHGGFIPWDDDIDIGMFSDDYYKFIKYGPDLISKQYTIQTHETEKEWYMPFMKIRKNGTTAIESYFEKRNVHQGIWIDIIPFEKQTDDIKVIKKEERIRKRLIRRIGIFYKRKAKFKGKVYDSFILLTHFSKEKTYKKMMGLLVKYKYSNYDKIGSVFHDKTNPHLLFNYKDFVSLKSVPFETTSILIPSNYDNILKTQYGDWKRIPDESERNGGSGHTITYVNINEDYTFYLQRRQK